jgi:hypothetical protein
MRDIDVLPAARSTRPTDASGQKAIEQPDLGRARTAVAR